MNKLGSAFGALAVIAISVIFILQFGPASNAARTDTGPRCAVEVRGACISRPTYDAARRLLGMGGDPARLRSMGFNSKVADGLLEAWLLGQDAKRLGIGVSDEEITAEIAAGRAHVSLPASSLESLGYYLRLGPDQVRFIPVKNPKTKKFDAKYVEKQIRNYSQMSPADWREYQRGELTAARMREIIKSRVRISEEEAFERYSQEQSTVTLDYARFDRRFFSDLLVDLSPKAIDAWAESHKDEIDKVWEARKAQVLPECRSVREILVRLPEAATDEEKAKARAKIDRARERIQKGEDFAEVARAMSEGNTAAHGGELGCLLKGKTPKPLEDAAAVLPAGKVSDVVSSDAGFYLVKVDRIAKDAEAEKLGRADAAKELYLGMEAERLAVEASKKVAAAVKGGKPLKEAIDVYLAELSRAEADKAAGKKDKAGDKKKAADKKKAGDKAKGDDKAAEDKGEGDDRPALTVLTHPARPILETTIPFNITNAPIPGVKESAQLGKIAFGLEKPGDAPVDAIPFDDGYVAIQLKEKTPASKEQWEKNKAVLTAQMRGLKANDALVAYLKRLHGQLASDARTAPELVNEKAPKGGESAPAPMDDEPGE